MVIEDIFLQLSNITLAGLFYNGTAGRLPCNNIETQFIECADPTGCGTGPAATSWDYQVCVCGGGGCRSINLAKTLCVFTDDMYVCKSWKYMKIGGKNVFIVEKASPPAPR